MENKDKEESDIKKYFDYFLKELPYRDVLDLYLIFIEERPACLVMNTEPEEVRKLENFCREFDLHYRVEEGKSKISGESVFITTEQDRLEMLEKSSGRFCGFTDIQVGRFLGFPEEDVEYFSENITDGQIEPEVRQKAEKMVQNGVLTNKDLKYLDIVSYVPKPEESNILKAVEKGKRYERSIKGRSFGDELRNKSELFTSS